MLSEHAAIQVDLCPLLSARLFGHDLEVRLEVHVEQQNVETEKMHVQKYHDGSGIHHLERTQPPPPKRVDELGRWLKPLPALLLLVAEKGYHLKPGLTSV